MIYSLFRTIYFNSTRQKISTKNLFSETFVRILHKILFIKKYNKPNKVNLVRRIYFCSTPHKIFINFYILEGIKSLLNDFRK